MFCKIVLLISTVSLIYSCKTNENLNPNAIYVNDSIQIERYLNKKQIDSFIAYTNLNINKIDKLNDNNIYIKYNLLVSQKLRSVGSDWQLLKKYCNNILKLTNCLDLDTNSIKTITNLYYDWAEISFQNEYRSDDSVIICLEKAISLNKKNNALPLGNLIYAYKLLGILYNQIGDLKKSIFYAQLEAGFINKKYENWVASNTVNIAIVLKEIGQLDSAKKAIANTLIYKNIAPLIRADLLTILSEIQTQKGEYIEAAFNINNGVTILDTLDKITSEVEEKKAQAYKQKGILERLNNEYPKSIETQLQALKHYKATGNLDGRGIAKIYIELGKSYQTSTQYDSALKYYQVALQKVVPVDSADYFSNPLPTQLYAENTIMEALDAKANVLQQKFIQTADNKYLAAAINCYKISFEVERKLMQNFSYDESRMLMLKESKKRSDQAITICHKLFNATKNNNWANEAFLFAEKSKAFVLLESVKRNIATNTILQNDSNYQRIQYLNARLAFLDKETILLHGVKSDSLKAVYDKQKTTLNNELLLANNELSRNNAAYQIMNNKEDSLSIVLAQQNILDNNTAFIEFFAGDSSTYIFSFTKNTNCTFFKATDTIVKTLNSFLSFFTDKNKINNNPTAYQAAAHTLYTQLNFAAIDTTTITKYIIIPDGDFNLLPIEALVSSIKTENNPKYFDYVLLHKQINYNYSAATILKQIEYQGNVSNNTTTCFAPIFANNERGNTPLLHTIEEFDAIKKETNNGHYFLQQQATIGNFKKYVKTAGLLHIATHANANVANGIQQPQIEFYDSTLYLNELYAMHINPNLVVLSACQTGIGEIDKSEGSMSLARGFYYAGAKNIITSLWNVNDKSTASLFTNFYSNIKQSNYTTALQKAKLTYLQNAPATAASPYYWASFIHIGYSKNKTGSNFIGWFIAALVILGLILQLSKYKK